MFDVADTIDLVKIGRARRGHPCARRAAAAAPGIAVLQFPVPPLVADLPDAELDGLRGPVRLKFYDYGVISLRLSLSTSTALGTT